MLVILYRVKTPGRGLEVEGSMAGINRTNPGVTAKEPDPVGSVWFSYMASVKVYSPGLPVLTKLSTYKVPEIILLKIYSYI
jgi:hypothetical protein